MNPQPSVLDRRAFLPAFALARPVTVLMCLFSAIVLGGIAYLRLPLALAPDKLDNPFLFISMPYPSSDPKEVEKKISKPVEEILGSVKGIDRLRSFSNESGATFWVDLKQEVNVDAVYADVKDRMERVEKELPEDFDRYFVYRWRGTDWPVVMVGFSGVGSSSDPDELYRLLDEKVKVRLQRIDGVASVDAEGLRRKRVLVKLRQDRLEAHNLDLNAIHQALSRGNFSLSGGVVSRGGIEHYIRSMAKFESLEEIRDLPIPGTPLRLSAVADVVAELPELERIALVDHQPSVLLMVKKESTANTVKVCRETLAAIAELKNDPELSGLRHIYFFNQGEMVQSSLDNLLSSGYWGGAFAVLILYVFLRRVRPTLLIALSIPLSLLVTLVALYFLGMNLNIGSMLGLMIGIGMLVDNSIVVVENVFRLHDEGMPMREAALRGTSEVGVAIIASTGTTAIVFLPLLFMSGEMGVWMFEIGLPVAISIIVSLIVALTIIPLAMAHMPVGQLFSAEAGSGRFRRGYGRFLAATLAHRVETLLAIFGVLALTVLLGSQSLIFTDDPGSDNRRISMHLHHENAKSLDASRQIFFRTEKIFDQHRDELEIQNVYLNFDRLHGDIDLFLTPKRKLKSTEQIAERVRELLPKIPGTIVRVNQQEQGGGEAVELRLQGEDSALLEVFAQEAGRRLERVAGVTDVNNGLEERRDEVNLTIERHRSWRQGLSAQQIAGTLALGVRGRKVGVLRGADRDLDILLQLGDEKQTSLAVLMNLPLPVRPSEPEPEARDARRPSLPLSTMASVRFSRGLGEIQRQEGMVTLVLKVSTSEKDLELLRGRIAKALEGFELPHGYSWSFGGRFRRINEDQSQSSLSGLLAVVLVFLIMGVLFESFLHPFTVMLTLPFAWLGFVWMMAATRTPVDILGSVGLIVLIGVVVNNSIVVVDRINQLRESGWERERAIVQAGMDRMRPVLMTALTSILGLVPMALDATLIQYKFNELLQAVGLGFLQLGSGNASMILYNSLGRAIMGGLIAGTMSTLLLTPYFYLLFDELRLYLRRLASSLLPGSPKK